MSKRTAVLLDGGFVLLQLRRALGQRELTADDVLRFAHACIVPGEELFRIYYYDCPPFGRPLVHPMSRVVQDFSKTAVYASRTRLLDELEHSDHVAFRAGVLSAGGWKLTYRSQQDLMKRPRACVATDFQPDFNQKRVDMKIGLDVAWLSSKGIVDRIVLVTADSDFVPAMKFARREGVQVVLVPMGSKYLHKALRAHADEVREVLP